MPSVEREIIEQLSSLDEVEKGRVLEFTKALAVTKPKGISGRTLLSFAGEIEPSDLEIMTQAIEEGCERIDASDW